MEKNVYCLKLDGSLLPDTHLFCFSDPLTAILTLYLFSVTFASKHIQLYRVGSIDSNGIITSVCDRFVCDYNNGKDLLVSIRQSDPDKYKDNPVTLDYINSICSDVDRVISEKYMNKEGA